MKNIKSIISATVLTIVLSTSVLAGDIAGMRTQANATGNIPGLRTEESVLQQLAVAIKSDIPGMLVGIISIR